MSTQGLIDPITTNQTVNLAANKEQEPSMKDILTAIGQCATKTDLESFSQNVKQFYDNTEAQFVKVDTQITTLSQNQDEQTTKIAALEENVELLKQDRLRNNIRISGIIPNWDGDCKKLVMQIITKINVQATPHDFKAYATKGNKFVIASFFNYAHKTTLLNKMRVKKSLMVEEIFPGVNSNSQLYINDHLTPYLTNLFIAAFKAKKEGKLASASSWGGSVRIRKHINDPPTVITHISQLTGILNMDTTIDSMSTTESDKNASSPTQINQQTTTRRGRPRGTSVEDKTATKNRKRKATGSTDQAKQKAFESTNSSTPQRTTGNNTNN